MASYDEHIAQAKSNLLYLQHSNATSNSTFWDWQVTTCFYVAVHLINAHIARQANQHYRRHDVVSDAINPRSSRAVCPVPQTVYVAYGNLQLLSRRSRYLISDIATDYTVDAQFTTEIHFSRAIRNLDKILDWMNITYGCILPTITVTCELLKDCTILKCVAINQPTSS